MIRRKSLQHKTSANTALSMIARVIRPKNVEPHFTIKTKIRKSTKKPKKKKKSQ